MKTFTALFQELLAVWLVLVITESSCAIFYTKSNDVDSKYPRIGRRSFVTPSSDGWPHIERRAFFTGGNKGSNYPRIGRSSLSNVQSSNDMSGLESHILSAAKRGIFTKASDGLYLRVGRQRGSQGGPQEEQGQEELPPVATLMTSAADPKGTSESGEDRPKSIEVPLALLFFALDTDGDKTLSRGEFVKGMGKAREDGTACR